MEQIELYPNGSYIERLDFNEVWEWAKSALCDKVFDELPGAVSGSEYDEDDEIAIIESSAGSLSWTNDSFERFEIKNTEEDGQNRIVYSYGDLANLDFPSRSYGERIMRLSFDLGDLEFTNKKIYEFKANFTRGYAKMRRSNRSADGGWDPFVFVDHFDLRLALGVALNSPSVEMVQGVLEGILDNIYAKGLIRMALWELSEEEDETPEPSKPAFDLDSAKNTEAPPNVLSFFETPPAPDPNDLKD